MNQEYENLVDYAVKNGYLKTPSIIEAFKKIDRADFVPEDLKDSAYLNIPLPIGFGQTISQPIVVAFMLELLEPKSGDKILDVGCGSGWTTALLAHLVDAGGRVIGIDRILELKQTADKNVAKYNFIEKGIVEVILGDGSKGYKKEAPFDKIIAGAAAYKNIPKSWGKQLKIGGRIVAPVKNSILSVDKASGGEFVRKEYFGFSFVPLIEEND